MASTVEEAKKRKGFRRLTILANFIMYMKIDSRVVCTLDWTIRIRVNLDCNIVFVQL